MRRRDFSNSPLEKGDKGGCEAEVGALSSRNGRRNQETTPSAPFIKGEFSANPDLFPCPAGLMGKDQVSGRFTGEKGDCTISFLNR
jgi:hypothetical protein